MKVEIPLFGMVAIALVFLIGIGFIIATMLKLEKQVKAQKN